LSNKGKAKKRVVQEQELEATNKQAEGTSVSMTPEQKKKVAIALLKEPLKVEPKTTNQAKFMKAVKDSYKDIVIGSGVAGTGKTFLALATALNLLREKNNEFCEIIIYKSVTQLKGEETGFLPGSQEEKLAYVYESFYDQFERLISRDIFKKLVMLELIKVRPLGSIRGLSMNKHRIVLVDEFQNLSIINGHTVVTRMEEGSKLIITGDIYQRDKPNPKDNALKFMTTYYKGVDPAIGIIEFTKDDVVRSPLIKKLQDIYEEHGMD
jgi:phosphate starvation-inducible protein PhoH and related proteins